MSFSTLIRTTLAACFLTILLLTGCQTLHPGPAATGGTVQWRSLAEAKAGADRKDRPLLIDFYTTRTCPRCSGLEEIYQDPRVAARIENLFIPVRISLDRPFTPEEEELNLLLGGARECKLVFLNPDGSVIRDSEGRLLATEEMLTKDAYLRYMEQALQ